MVLFICLKKGKGEEINIPNSKWGPGKKQWTFPYLARLKVRDELVEADLPALDEKMWKKESLRREVREQCFCARGREVD